jgi:hypothetical protein
VLDSIGELYRPFYFESFYKSIAYLLTLKSLILKMKMFQRIISLYFFIGAIVSYIVFVYLIPKGDFISYLKPNLIALVVFLSYAIVSYLFYKNPSKEVFQTSFIIMLLIQSLKLKWNGYSFNNFYSPLYSIKINLQQLSNLDIDSSWFKIKQLNGYFTNDTEVSISFNLVLIVLAIIVAFNQKKITESFSN